MRVFCVLMWKHAVVRLRRFIHTTVEVVCPLLFFLLVFLLHRPFIQGVKNISSPPKGDMADTDIIPIENIEPRPYWLMYTPESMLTNSLMSDVGEKLKLKRLGSNPDFNQQGYFPFPEGSRLLDIAAKMKTTQALLIFNNMSGEKWPTHLNYTIRMKGDFGTDEIGLQDKTPSRPPRTFSFQYGTFLVIQWAVDTSYIKMLTGTEIPQNLSFQTLPKSTMISKIGIAIVCVVLNIVCWLSLMLTFVFHTSRLLQERASGIQELIKMVGVSLTTLGLCHFLNVLPVGVIFAATGALLCKVTSEPMVPETNGFIIFLMLLLYFNSVIAFAFVCSYISRSTQYAVTLSGLMYSVSYTPTYYLEKRNMKYKWRLLTGLLPHTPLMWFWNDVTYLEIDGEGANFNNITERHTQKFPSILVGFLFMLLQILICYVLTWYLSLVRPGQYGQALPWNFLFKRKPKEKRNIAKNKNAEYEMSESEFSILSADHYTKPYYEVRRTSERVRRRNDYDINEYEDYLRREEESSEDEEDRIFIDSRYFEPGPPHTEAGIEVVNVSKVYPKHTALNKVSLEVYKGEITVLLGHNGAGKTTLMSIITGLTSATEGHVFVNGKDSVRQKSEVRKYLGYCPQHNLFFDDLTLRQNIVFFTMIKRGSYFEAKHSASQLAEQLGLSDKLSSMPRQLSGGMKRRAQLACALAGGADVLVLDEPTSGLDVETRRGLWDLLLSLRGQRTVLLTTHFMEEADALGDRVAALSGGVLRCYASPMYLKKAVGTGYRLSLTTKRMPKEEAITRVVTSHVHGAKLREHTNNSLSYNLPAAQSSKFSKLFSALEAKRSKLGIDSIGVGVSTLEEVFLKLCSDIDTSPYEDEEDDDSESDMPPDRLNGILLYMRQLYVLLKRQVKYAIHKKWVFLFLQLIVPIVTICMVTIMVNKMKDPKSRALVMNLDLFKYPHIVLYRLEGPHVTQADVNKLRLLWLYKGIFINSDDITKEIDQMSRSGSVEYELYLGALEFDNLGFKARFISTNRHAAPIVLNLLSNMLAAHYISWSDGNSIITVNDPVGREIDEANMKEPKSLMNVVTWGITVIFVILSTNINNISLPCKERLSGARHIHIMSGCPVELHWLATFSFHMTLSILGLIVPTLLAANYLDRDNTFNQTDMLVTLALILILGCMAFLAFSYLVSLNFTERVASIFLVTCVVIFATTAYTKVLIECTVEEKEKVAEKMKKSADYYIIVVISYIVTPHIITETALKCLNVGRINAWCELAREFCPTLLVDDMAFDTEKCCAGETPRCYFCIDEYSPGLGIILLLVHFLVLMTLLIMTERGIFNGLIDKVMNMQYNPTQPPEQDEMVRAEKAYVNKAINLPADRIPDAMLVGDLHKNYVRFCSKNVNAIKGVSFSVKKGECFGLLGVNGAGKSTCFKMITTEECPTRGNIFSNGFFLRRGNSQYLRTLGYCPQFFGLDMFQTGEENLAMVLTLRGFDKEEVEDEVENWIQIVGLEKYARQRVEGYSGGCVRRLGTASALCGSAELALLDEPTAGVDVAARRRLWTALRRALKSQRAVVITSHSMDEMEALCSRIAILAGGRVRALGTAAALRAAHAQGHAVIFKIKRALPGDDVDGAKAQVKKLKGQLQEMFNCTLKDEHKTMLHYHINETMPYSTLFAELEALHEDYPALIEDYSVTETTLEEVFLSFAKEQQVIDKQAV